MTIKEIKEWIKKIEAERHDDEIAHCEEDALREEFIKYIANGGKIKIKEKAKLILTTLNIDFCRWCA